MLWNEGFISGYSTLLKNNKNYLKVFLKYNKTSKPVISYIKLFIKTYKKVNYFSNLSWKLDLNKTLIILLTTKGLKSMNNYKKIYTSRKPIPIAIVR